MVRLRSGVLGLVFTSAVALASANAADMYRAPEGGGLKDGPYIPVNTWTGFYIGVNGGFGWNAGDARVAAFADDDGITDTSPTKKFDRDGGFGGGQIGYNWQHSRFVFGIEADIQGSGIDGSGTAVANADGGDVIATARASSRLDWFGTVRGRLGYSFDRALIYATGGFAFGGVKDHLSLTADDTQDGGSAATFTSNRDDTRTGFVVGGGIEYAISPAWSLKGEYQYIDLGRTKGTFAVADDVDGGNAAAIDASIDHTFHTARVGLNYHLHPGYEPLK